MDRDRVIGLDHGMPWKLPRDMSHFRRVTMGKPIIMGRKTHESIGQALPGRDNHVISRQVAFNAPGCELHHSLNAAIDATAGADEIVVIGGAELYSQALAQADCMYLTRIEHNFVGDTWFPRWQAHEWCEFWREAHAADDKNPHALTFINLARVRA